MGKYSNKGMKRNWVSKVSSPSVMTRQRRRALRRVQEWESVSGSNALRDSHGIIPRRIRRDMARLKAKRG